MHEKASNAPKFGAFFRPVNNIPELIPHLRKQQYLCTTATVYMYLPRAATLPPYLANRIRQIGKQTVHGTDWQTDGPEQTGQTRGEGSAHIQQETRNAGRYAGFEVFKDVCFLPPPHRVSNLRQPCNSSQTRVSVLRSLKLLINCDSLACSFVHRLKWQ